MKRKYVFWIVAGMLALWLLHGGLTVMGSEEGSPALTVRREGEDLWSLSLSADPLALTSGDPMALLVSLQAPEGWRIGKITVGRAAEGLILTHGDLPAEEVKVLLDGRAAASDEGEILWVRMEKTTQEPQKQGGYMGVTGGDGEALTLFVLRGSGKVEVIPVTVEVERDPTGWEETTDALTEESCPPMETEHVSRETEETAADTAAEPSDTASTLPPCSGESPLSTGFLGCRETRIADGRYAVQFLFAGRETPVICMEGGGVISAVSGSARVGSEVWSACIFRGLDGERRYVFFVGTCDGWVIAIYEGGSFQGFFPQ